MFNPFSKKQAEEPANEKISGKNGEGSELLPGRKPSRAFQKAIEAVKAMGAAIKK